MIIKHIDNVEKEELKSQEIKYDTKQVLIGNYDGSENMIMRLFTLKPGGYTPYHKHNFEHVIKVEKGEGIAIDKNGEHKISEGMVLFVKPNEIHQFKNTSDDILQFICIIPYIKN